MVWHGIEQGFNTALMCRSLKTFRLTCIIKRGDYIMDSLFNEAFVRSRFWQKGELRVQSINFFTVFIKMIDQRPLFNFD